MSTSDDDFRAEGPGLFGFLADSDDDNIAGKAFGVVGYGVMTGVLGFSGGEADPEGRCLRHLPAKQVPDRLDRDIGREQPKADRHRLLRPGLRRF